MPGRYLQYAARLANTLEERHNHGKLRLEVYSWTVDDPAEAVRLIGLGVSGITTNRPGWLREQVPSLKR